MRILKPFSTAIFIFSSFALLSTVHPPDKTFVKPKESASKIQVAVLLDVSNSMDGLIAQAKAQLWNMVNVLGKAKCNDAIPSIEIALYEYGRSDNDENQGYVKQITPFTNDLDKVSQSLFSLTTKGGQEYCGHVMYSSLTQMQWDTAAASYKVIFIAGNEDFLQGNVSFTQACAEAKKKNVVINTIYCGDKQSGIREHWNLGSECGGGSFTNINPDAAIDEIDTPFDSTLIVLNEKLNDTYMAYGYRGSASLETQASVDKQNVAMSKSVAMQRINVKSQAKLYDNRSWDLVDANNADKNIVYKLKKDELPDSLQNKSKEEVLKVITAKGQQRQAIQKEIAEVNIKREAFIKTEKSRKATAPASQTLETEIEKIIRQQAARYNITIK